MEAHRVANQFGLIAPVIEQPQYNMFERNKVELDYLPVYQNVGLGTTIWSPLAAGFLTGKYLDGYPEGSRLGLQGFEWLKDRWMQADKLAKLKDLSRVAQDLGISLAVLAIAWTISNPHVTTAILGATRASQVEENLTALDALPLLTPEVLQRIDDILANKPSLNLS